MKKTFYNRREHAGFYRETPHYPSADNGCDCTSKKESQQYTGDYVIGIGTMHKSNLVPITRGEGAKDIARMRRN